MKTVLYFQLNNLMTIMEDFLYYYNKPVVNGKYDLILDGKIVANEIVTKNGSVGGEGMTEEERKRLVGAAQKNSDNTFKANNTFTGTLDISNAQIVTPDGWNVGELTAEQVQAVVPIAWDNKNIRLGGETRADVNGTAVGYKAQASGTGNVAVGVAATTATNYNVAIGEQSLASGVGNVAIGNHATAKNSKIPLLHGSIAIGNYVLTDQENTITLGAHFTEKVDNHEVTHICTTQGAGSITIGAGANTLNPTDADGNPMLDSGGKPMQSSNAVTIGCKADNRGADSVVIGALAKDALAKDADLLSLGVMNGNVMNGNVVIGAEASAEYPHNISIGKGAITKSANTIAIGAKSLANYMSLAIGAEATAEQSNTIAIGQYASALQAGSIAIGNSAKANDIGVAVMRMINNQIYDYDTITRLYIAAANTPLANDYEGGEAMMGYVVTDNAGNKLAAGTQKLSVLFPNNSTFQPATLDENGEWVMPKVFHPSDLDMPIEQPSEPDDEEYQPLPVYPIVEPTIDEITN